MTTPSGELKVGSPFGPYLVEESIAGGGMASLWRAHVTGEPERPVVLKTMLPHVALERDCVAMFMREASLGALFSHDNIVPIHDVGVILGRHFIEMSYIEGRNLRQLLRRCLAGRERSPLPVAVALGALCHACDALAYIHDFPGDGDMSAGLVHRDVSPENLMAGFDGKVRLLDFGVATSELSTWTQTGQIKGKLHYMGPEVFAGRSSESGRDVYAAGVTLYELLTGQRPFRADNEAELMYHIAHSPLRAPTSLRPELPPEVDDMVAAALERNPDRRCTAVELGDRVRAVLAALDARDPSEIVAEAMINWFPNQEATDEEDVTELTSDDIRGPAPELAPAAEDRRSVFDVSDPVLPGLDASEGIATKSAFDGVSQRSMPSTFDSVSPPLRSPTRVNWVDPEPEKDIFTVSRRMRPIRETSTSVFTMYTRSGSGADASRPASNPFGAPLEPIGEPAPPSPSETPPVWRNKDALRHFERGLEYKRNGQLEATLGEWEVAARLEPSNRMIASNVRLMRQKLRR